MVSKGALGTQVASAKYLLGLEFPPSTLRLLFLVRGAPAPLLRACLISSVTLGLHGKEVDRTRLVNTPSKTLKHHLYRFVETVPIPTLDCSLQQLAYVGTVCISIKTVAHNHCRWLSFPVGLSMRVHRWM